MTKAGRSNYKPFWGRCQFPRSTHTYTHCRISQGAKRIFWRQSYRCRSASPSELDPEHRVRPKPRIEQAKNAQARRKGGVLTRTSEMRSGLPCALRHWQRLQPASRWRLGSYSFSADRLPTFIVYSSQEPTVSDLTSRYVFFDIVSN